MKSEGGGILEELHAASLHWAAGIIIHFPFSEQNYA